MKVLADFMKAEKNSCQYFEDQIGEESLEETFLTDTKELAELDFFPASITEDLKNLKGPCEQALLRSSNTRVKTVDSIDQDIYLTHISVAVNDLIGTFSENLQDFWIGDTPH